MTLFSVGINHKTASIGERERMHLQADDVRTALRRLSPDILAECLIVSTCNRTEVFGVPANDDVSPDYVKDFLLSFREVRGEIGREKFFTDFECGAITHFYHVAAGIDSLILGDSQILGQVRDAYRLSVETGAAGPVINRLCHTAFAVGKSVRSETHLSDGAVSVSYAAVELASKIFDDLASRAVLVLGAGDTAEIALRILADRGVRNINVANRTRERAEELVANVRAGRVIPFEQFADAIPEADVVITSVAVQQPIVTRDMIRAAMKRRKSRSPLFIVDIGLPRNVESSARDLSNVFLHDIDSLQVIVEQNLARRRSEIPLAEEIIQHEADETFRWLNALEVVPTIRALRARFDRTRMEELEKYRHRFTPEQYELLQDMTRRMVRRLLHAPTVNLKELAARQDDAPAARIELIRMLFELDIDPANLPSPPSDQDDIDPDAEENR